MYIGQNLQLLNEHDSNTLSDHHTTSTRVALTRNPLSMSEDATVNSEPDSDCSIMSDEELSDIQEPEEPNEIDEDN